MFAVLCFVLLTCVLLLDLRLLFVSDEILSHSSVISKYGFVYEDLNYTDKFAKLYNFLFVYRRIIVCIFYLYLIDYMEFQIILTVFQNQMMMMLVGSFQPFRQKLINQREMFNEFMILTMTLNLMLFTDFANSPSFQYDIAGWWYVSTIILVLVFNLSLLFKDLVHYTRLVIKRFYIRLRHHIDIAKTAKTNFNLIFRLEEQMEGEKLASEQQTVELLAKVYLIVKDPVSF